MLLYASSSIGSEALARSRSLWLVYYYAPPSDVSLPTLLPSILVGLLLLCGTVVSAFDFLVIGYFSDRTRSRWGRRIPYIVTGAPLASVFAVLVFVAPPDAGTAATAVYFFVALELMFLFTALGNGPYDALLPELAQ